LDSSTKTVGDAWTRILEFTNLVIAGYNIRANCVRVTVICYSDNAVVCLELNRYNDINSLQQAVRQLRLLNVGSNLANAFNLLRTRVFNFAGNVIRPGATLIAVVVTDSQIQPSQPLTSEANSVKSQGVRVIAVGIRVDANTLNVLYAVSSNRYAVSVNDYSQLPGVVSRVVEWGCFLVPTTPPPVIGN